MDDEINIRYINKISNSEGIVKCSSLILGRELIAIVAKQCNTNSAEMRCLLQGKYLKEELSLKDQKLGNNSRLLIMKGASQEKKVEMQHKAEKEESTQRIIKAAEKVASRTDGDDGHTYFEVENQFGAQMNLDPEDRKNIIKGMTLHEKGKKKVEKDDIDTGIKFFLEADSAFQAIKDPTLINSIDNYALLCLDINWAYLRKNNSKEIVQNSWRLDKAHTILKKAYGENNERLVQLKGGCCPELVNYVRLFLLQAITAYNNGDLNKAKYFVGISEEKLQQMTISEEDVLDLMQMGFTMQEARIGLRAVNKNKNDATVWILSRREKIEQKKKEEREKRRRERRQKKFGKTAKGNYIDIQLLDGLMTLGFSEEIVAEALKQSENQQEQALNLLMNSPNLLLMALAKEPSTQQPAFIPSEQDILNIVSIGFSPEQAYGTLKLTRGNIQDAVDLLLNEKGVEEPVPQPPNPPPTSTNSSETQNSGQDATVTATRKEIDKKTEEENRRRIEEAQKLAEAEEELVQDHTEDDDVAHLAINLTEEQSFLAQYKALIMSTANN